MIKENKWLWILFLAAIFLYTFNLGELPLRDWDEGIVATVAREILKAESGDYTWLYPQNIDGSPYWNKPPLMHNLIALSYQFFGVSEWSTRLFPSIISALCVPLVYFIGREVFANKKIALLSAVVYLTVIPVVRHNRLAMLDGAVTFEFCLAIWCLLKLQNSSYKRLYIFGIGLSLGLLCLTKGIAIALLLSCIILLFIIAEIKTFLPLFSWQTIFILTLGISPAIVWYGLQYAHYGREFINYNLGTQTFNRVINSVENNSQPVWYYLVELVEYSLPWLIFLPEGIKLAIKQWDKIWAKLALIWFGVYFVAISLMTTKLPWYIMPLYPAFALLVGANLERIFERKKKHKNNIYKILLLLLSVIFWFASVYYAFFSNPRDTDLFLIAVILADAFTLSIILISRQSNYFVVSLAIGLYIALLTLFNTPHAIWELAEAYPVKPVAKLVRDNTPPETTIYTSYPYYRPSLNFYSDRSIVPISEVNLQQIVSSNKETYLLLSKDAPNIHNSKILNAIEEWRIAVIN